LLRALATTGCRAVGFKPVAAGVAPDEAVHADVRQLVAAGNVAAPLDDVNPYLFAAPIAPEIAAREVGATIALDRIESAYRRLGAGADAIVVEGAGGALVPLARGSDMLDIAARLQLPVLLVVGIRLGCINHALLTALATGARGLRLAGWVANRIDPAMPACDENVATLVERIPAPLVADLRWCADGTPDFAAPRAVLRMLGFA